MGRPAGPPTGGRRRSPGGGVRLLMARRRRRLDYPPRGLNRSQLSPQRASRGGTPVPAAKPSPVHWSLVSAILIRVCRGIGWSWPRPILIGARRLTRGRTGPVPDPSARSVPPFLAPLLRSLNFFLLLAAKAPWRVTNIAIALLRQGGPLAPWGVRFCRRRRACFGPPARRRLELRRGGPKGRPVPRGLWAVSRWLSPNLLEHCRGAARPPAPASYGAAGGGPCPTLAGRRNVPDRQPSVPLHPARPS